MKNQIFWILICFIIIFQSFLFAETNEAILTLENSIEIALEKSYNIKVLKLRVINAREQLKAAQGRFRTSAMMDFEAPAFSEQLSSIQQGYGFAVYNTRGLYRYQGNLNIIQPLPTNGEIRLRSSGSHLSESYLTQSSADTNTKRFSSSVSLIFTQPLFTINELQYGLKRASLNYEMANKFFSRRELDIVYQVTSDFYNVYQLTREEEIALDQSRQQATNYELARRKYEAGLIPEGEVLQMEVDYAESRNNLLKASGALKRGKDAFKQLIGLKLEDKIGVQTKFEYQSIQIDSSKAITEGLKHRAEIREGEIELELAQMSVKETDSQWEIKGELSAFYDLSGISTDNLADQGWRTLLNSSLDDLKERPRNKGVTFRLTVPIWDWGVNRAQVQAAKVAVETNEYDLTELRKTIVREVASAIDAVREAWNRLEVLEKSESVAARSYEISLKRFENGELTTQELVLDQQRLTNARQAFLSAFISYKLAIADLTRKTMFDFEKGRSLAK